VARVLQTLCGTEVSSSQVSRAAAQLDEALVAWRGRKIGACPYLILEPRYETVRQDGQTLDAAVLIAIGLDPDGKRRVLGVSVSLGEHEVH
jgi:putative transposase